MIVQQDRGPASRRPEEIKGFLSSNLIRTLRFGYLCQRALKEGPSFPGRLIGDNVENENCYMYIAFIIADWELFPGNREAKQKYCSS